MRILVVIPHYYREIGDGSTNKSHRPAARAERARALVRVVTTLHAQLGRGCFALDHWRKIAWQVAPSRRHELEILVCTLGDDHLLGELPQLAGLCAACPVRCEPLMLGFECHKVMAERRDAYDYYLYLEDDVVVADPLFFRKRELFDRAHGPWALLQPHRFELSWRDPVRKLYVDYAINPGLTRRYHDISVEPRLCLPFLDETVLFERTTYPSAGCFLLDREQLRLWCAGPHFLDGDVSYMSPLDSAVTLSVMKTFRTYKAVLDQASFLEVEHASPRWIGAVTQQARLVPRDRPFAALEPPAG